MKLIDQSAFKYLSVKLPMLGAFFMLVLIPLLQWALDFQLIPKDYEALVVGVVISLLAFIGKKIYQPNLHADVQVTEILSFAKLQPNINMSAKGFAHVKKVFFGGKLQQSHVDNINSILNAVNKHNISNIKQVAYLLATAYHETNATMQPVREAYWLSEAWRKKNLRYYPWYGRGHVQLTWQVNYKKADDKLGLKGLLIKNPDLAMRSDISAEVLVIGSKEGWFTGRKLDDYISNVKTDYVGARRIINGTDKAKQIADVADVWEEALKM